MAGDHLKVNGRLQKNLRPFNQKQSLVKAKVNCGKFATESTEKKRVFSKISVHSVAKL